MFNLFKRRFCKHIYKRTRIVSGDEINQIKARSVWCCKLCNDIRYSDYVDKLK